MFYLDLDLNLILRRLNVFNNYILIKCIFFICKSTEYEFYDVVAIYKR